MASKRTAKQWGQSLEDLAAGKRNPRVLVVEINEHMKRTLAWLGRRWSTSMITYDVVDGNPKWRTKRPDEMPENDPAEWTKLAEYARAVALTAERLADFADLQRVNAEIRNAGK